VTRPRRCPTLRAISFVILSCYSLKSARDMFFGHRSGICAVAHAPRPDAPTAHPGDADVPPSCAASGDTAPRRRSSASVDCGAQARTSTGTRCNASVSWATWPCRTRSRWSSPCPQLPVICTLLAPASARACNPPTHTPPALGSQTQSALRTPAATRRRTALATRAPRPEGAAAHWQPHRGADPP